MLGSMFDCFSSGPRSIQPPVEQYVPTLKELTTSGAVPERIAAVIFVSVMSPTTFTVTSEWFRSYSAATCLNTLSSCVADPKPTQIVIFVALADAWAEFFAVAPTAAATTASSTSKPIAPRLIYALLCGRIVIDPRVLPPAFDWNLVKVPNEDSTTALKSSQAWPDLARLS